MVGLDAGNNHNRESGIFQSVEKDDEKLDKMVTPFELKDVTKDVTGQNQRM